MSVREPGVQVRFFQHAMLHGKKSLEAGRQIWVDVPHVEIVNAGQDKQKFVGPVNEQHEARFPEEYALFLKGEQEVRVGTPIEQWPQITPSQVLMFKQLNVYSVEDVASLSDENVRNMGPGGFKLRDDAGKFLKLATAAADAGKIDEMLKMMAELKAANEAQAQRIAELEAKPEPKKKRETA